MLKKSSFTIAILLIAGVCTAFAQSNFSKAKDFVATKDYISAAPLILAATKESPKNLEVIALAGDIYRELEKPDSALVFYLKANDLESNNAVILRKLALTYSLLGKHTEAIEKMRYAIKKNDKDVYNYLTLGQLYIASDSLRQADFSIRKALSINDKIADGYVALGDLYYAQKVLELASQNYEEALKRDEKLIESRIKLARTYVRLANSNPNDQEANELFNKGLAEWDRIGREDPNNASAFFEQGKIYFLALQYSRAAKALSRFVQLRPDGKVGRWYLAQSLFEGKQYDSAIPHLEFTAKNLDSVTQKAEFLVARCYYYTKKYTLAATSFNNLSMKSPLKSEDIEKFGYASIFSGDTLNAIRRFQDAINEDPKKCRIMLPLANLLRERKQFPEAISVFKKRLVNCSDSMDAKVYYFIGICYVADSTKSDSAISSFQECLKRDSMNLYARNQLAITYIATKNSQLAKEQLTRSIELGKSKPEANKAQLKQAYSLLCGIILESKNFTEIKKIAEEWVGLDPESVYAHLYLAIAHQGLEETDKACKEYREVLKRDPQNKAAKQNKDALQCK